MPMGMLTADARSSSFVTRLNSNGLGDSRFRISQTTVMPDISSETFWNVLPCDNIHAVFFELLEEQNLEVMRYGFVQFG
jgi:hypothetical protein